MTQHSTLYHRIERDIYRFLLAFVVIALILGILHYLLHDISHQGRYWFNLDKERNIPSWFSGTLFCIFGAVSLVAFYGEHMQRREGHRRFRLPWLWCGVALFGLYLSLDEITILHENILWKEVRLFSDAMGPSWKYLTQWQILFAPFIVAAFICLIVFFSSRFRVSRRARYFAFGGLALWLTALLLEGTRELFKYGGSGWYMVEALIEEELEMTGCIALIGSVALYTLDISVDMSLEGKGQPGVNGRILTRNTWIALIITLCLLVAGGGITYYVAHTQDISGAQVPHLYQKALDMMRSPRR